MAVARGHFAAFATLGALSGGPSQTHTGGTQPLVEVTRTRVLDLLAERGTASAEVQPRLESVR